MNEEKKKPKVYCINCVWYKDERENCLNPNLRKWHTSEDNWLSPARDWQEEYTRCWDHNMQNDCKEYKEASITTLWELLKTALKKFQVRFVRNSG